ncbi:MAG: helical backbone metal receptor [Nitrospinota bacterium]|nr:helical backbone metal receptor [Nitrospinota bacterium]
MRIFPKHPSPLWKPGCITPRLLGFRPLAVFFQVMVFISFGVQSIAAKDPEFPQQIISLSPSITEVLFALGAGYRVVGVTDFCLYPEQAKHLPKVGGLLNHNPEAVISLQPDLLIHHYDSENINKFSDHLGIQSLSVSFDNLENIYRSIKKIGRALGTQERANRLNEKLRGKIRHYRSKIQGRKPKSVLLILGDSEDPMKDLYAVGKGTFLDELLTLAGGKNILSSSPVLYPKVSREYIISASPEIIIVAGPKARLSPEELKKKKKQWKRFTTVRAVKDGNVHYIGADYILIPGPRLTQIVENFIKIIHPEAGDTDDG